MHDDQNWNSKVSNFNYILVIQESAHSEFVCSEYQPVEREFLHTAELCIPPLKSVKVFDWQHFV